MPGPTANKAVLANPTAQALFNNKIELNSKQQQVLDTFAHSAHLAITEEDRIVLLNFYNEIKKQDSKLGKLYRTLSFDEFIVRLVTKRYDKAYLDGREIFPRQYTTESDPLRRFYKKYPNARNNNTFARQQLLDKIGTNEDEFDVYQEYLSLAELSISAMVLMVTSDIVIGRGARGNWCGRTNEWYQQSVREEFFREQAKNATQAAVFSYPAGIEFREMRSASLDTAYCLIMQSPTSEFANRRAMALANPALGETLHGLYGKKTALSFADFSSAKDDHLKNSNDWIVLQGGQTLLYKPAYQAKIERVLKQIILAHDQSMAELGMGKVLNIKGLGLGAFGISECNLQLEKLFVEALVKVHQELAPDLQYIKGINLINPPSLFKPGQNLPTSLQTLANSINEVKLTANCMDPTARYIVNPNENGYGSPEYEVGGVIFCGDPATAPGNEARVQHQTSQGIAPVGLQPDSSDDPAQMYTMAQPAEFDPIANPAMLKRVVILASQKTQELQKINASYNDVDEVKTKLLSPPPQKTDEQQKTNTSYSNVDEVKTKPVSPSPKKQKVASDYPDSYHRLYANGRSPIDSACQLLKDYTKDNSTVKRIFYGHWNRHHVVEVNKIVEQINANQITDMEDLLGKLKSVLKNNTGSLHRRIAFLEMKYEENKAPQQQPGL